MQEDIRWKQRFSNFETLLLIPTMKKKQPKLRNLSGTSTSNCLKTFIKPFQTRIMNDLFGFKPGEIELIRQILTAEPAVSEAYIFGSRAKGNYKSGSDVDIALKGQDLNLQKITRLSFILNEESVMPYFFDLIDYNTIKEVDLKNHIDRVGIKIFPL